MSAQNYLNYFTEFHASVCMKYIYCDDTTQPYAIWNKGNFSLASVLRNIMVECFKKQLRCRRISSLMVF